MTPRPVPSPSSEAGPAERASNISVRGVSKRYGRTLALDDVSLEVEAGRLFALLGPNGAGKTTLLHILSTILRPDSGVAEVAGVNVLTNPLDARQRIGMVFQEPSLDDRLTVQENLNFHGLVYGMSLADRRRRIEEMLELVELSDWREHLARQLSSGMKRRLEIARGLLHEPRILFLDEPTVGLDAQSRERIWMYLSELRARENLTIVVTTHYLEEVEYCDAVCIIDRGKVLAEGSPEELKAAHGKEFLRATALNAEAADRIHARHPEAIRSGNSLVIEVKDAAFAPAFLAAFAGELETVSIDRPSLESVFLTLTGRDLRDKKAEPRDIVRAAGQRGEASTG
ncbi:ABC transporter ATP-binding protein [Pelagibacterium lacus]|uniref:ABC transporter ATP-binding protein n=1 Tax=Pelagibacterium lacus TaxID=2282655 RepID=A0A369W6G1_9HYPH|nr:ABC transporter ATP-binding protein [Pelagibacterium lacus]RDE09923.1 ABC transporter ATP-binding protein [Pelagibacterium lacus]